MTWKKINEVVGRFYKNFSTLRKTVNRGDYCYFKLNDYYEIKCGDDYLVQFKYKPNSQDYYYMNYDYNNDSVMFYTTRKYSGYWKHSAPDNIVIFKNLTRLCTEEGHFQEMTRQDLTDFEIPDIISLLMMGKAIVDKTKEYRNVGTSST
ncbi:hypothetical protein pEaSNUABM50_00389 [Erwinia phage pEa_SNUABM_50]|uniref:Uncharacterized protein n=3 Tax=Eneladusvirus BF TaxID=2560751 RepID=A0A7L8ZPK2_9CAUD|nr:hypothetical protein pEaSNUABM12_00394 [Erwinia phage pEa_SNUABM_12]QOI71871.1 hypothetical protein pEaSNUABM47_00391 [Erwinia phage pEa_SNUABM_47]QOI72410.1 hypothetical protein pEaSNUABM50_00389 [Erwinia phage pEa_SNUABM_50]QXO11537.1 hypothetical protein pEaSNUABM19_00395 [Erwinia phage pEa_SNUABM_19]QXO12085.1 hypothetical protein pEaSNUABM44_00393 [Erwinia phage pEa_SNUABM_44]QXO12637.1 hypothetical protein pEaSNUABM49_00395 [Erwinia phage pEa_SNUABM_49]